MVRSNQIIREVFMYTNRILLKPVHEQQMVYVFSIVNDLKHGKI